MHGSHAHDQRYKLSPCACVRVCKSKRASLELDHLVATRLLNSSRLTHLRVAVVCLTRKWLDFTISVNYVVMGRQYYWQPDALVHSDIDVVTVRSVNQLIRTNGSNTISSTLCNCVCLWSTICTYVFLFLNISRLFKFSLRTHIVLAAVVTACLMSKDHQQTDHIALCVIFCCVRNFKDQITKRPALITSIRCFENDLFGDLKSIYIYIYIMIVAWNEIDCGNTGYFQHVACIFLRLILLFLFIWAASRVHATVHSGHIRISLKSPYV